MLSDYGLDFKNGLVAPIPLEKNVYLEYLCNSWRDLVKWYDANLIRFYYYSK